MDAVICHGYRIEIRVLIFYQEKSLKKPKTKGIIIIHKLKKDRQHNGEKKKDKGIGSFAYIADCFQISDKPSQLRTDNIYFIFSCSLYYETIYLINMPMFTPTC